MATQVHALRNLMTTALAPHFERHCGKVHRGGEPGQYCLHLPGKYLCAGGATRTACCWGER